MRKPCGWLRVTALARSCAYHSSCDALDIFGLAVHARDCSNDGEVEAFWVRMLLREPARGEGHKLGAEVEKVRENEEGESTRACVCVCVCECRAIRRVLTSSPKSSPSPVARRLRCSNEKTASGGKSARFGRVFPALWRAHSQLPRSGAMAPLSIDSRRKSSE